MSVVCGSLTSQELGRTASIELSPAQIHSPKLKYTLVGALDAAAASSGAVAEPPLAAGTKCFINMVKKSLSHFGEVGDAAMGKSPAWWRSAICGA